MSVTVDISYKSLRKHHEELCGDKVEILKTSNADIIILADGMGSGVKANILATLTSKILGTMFLNGARIEDCVQTIVKTLPICRVREIAYSTFSILQIFHTGEAYLVEFDNPPCVFIRDEKLLHVPSTERIIEGKTIHEYRFHVQKNDCFVLMSDGAIHAGIGQSLNFGWTWESMAQYSVKATCETLSSSRLATILSKACDDLYMHKPGDDTTIAVARVLDRRCVNLLTGPPLNRYDDDTMVTSFMESPGVHIVSGGTSANIVSRVLNRPVTTCLDYSDPKIPPIAYIDGIDLVTEGVLTLSRTVSLIRSYLEDDINEDFFTELDKKNGGSLIAKTIIEECSELHLFVGRTMNEAHQNPGLPFDLSIRMHLISQLADLIKKMGKHIEIKYY